jgi:hypothetical protein
MSAAAITSWLGVNRKPEPARQESKPASQSSVAWHLDAPQAQASPGGAEGLSISGTNVSDQALENVQAVLKPDAGERDLDLVLNVEGGESKDGSLIPPGAKFSLVSDASGEDASLKSGGAILNFRYVLAGQRKTSILPLTPAVLARLARTASTARR